MKLTNFSIKNANLGKIINFMAQDLAIVEMKFTFLFLLIVSPIFVILAAALLYYRMGPWGLLGVVILLLSFPL